MISEPNQIYTFYPHNRLFLKKDKKYWECKIHCAKCNKVRNPPPDRYKSNKTCLECILLPLSSSNKREIQSIEFDQNSFSPKKDIQKLVNLASFYAKWLKLRNFFSDCRDNNCLFASISHFTSFLPKLIIHSSREKLPICSECSKKRKNLKFFTRNEKDSEFFSLLQKISDINDWFNLLFLGPYSETDSSQNTFHNSNREILESYQLIGTPLYTVDIYSNTYNESILEIRTIFGQKSEVFYETLLSRLDDQLSSLNFDNLLSIGVIIKKYMEYIQNYLKIHYNNLNSSERQNLALYASVKKLNIRKIFPLLVDDLINEIYLDNPHQTVYIDHRNFGRCLTTIHFTDEDLNSIKTFLRISSNKRLDTSNPSIKASIHNQFFQCRFALDISPIVTSGFAMNVRKMNRKIFTIPELIKKGMFSCEIAAFLVICVVLRLNITAVGETNTGKTTLINSLDLIAPQHFRKIYIEESSESLDQDFAHSHQLKYNVDSVYKNSSKIREIYRLLHRNPDLVYLGEILTKEEARAMFHCLSAGLRGFQTIHARDIHSLINRWRYHFQINPACFNDLDIVIILKQGFTKRYISDIYEVLFVENSIKISPIFIYNSNSQQWESKTSLNKLSCIQRLSLSQREISDVNDQMSILNDVMKNLVRNQKWDVIRQVEFFHLLNNQIEILKRDKMKISKINLNPILEDIKWEKY